MEMQPAPGAPVPYPGAAVQNSAFHDPSGKYKLVYQGAFAAVEVAIGPNDGLKAESGAMVTMSNNLNVEAKVEGGVGSALMRCCCTGESFFMTHFTIPPGKSERGDVLVAPPVPGEILLLHLDGNTKWLVEPGGFLASDLTVTTGTQMLNLSKGCCGGEGLFVIKAEGVGRLLVNSYGSIVRYDLQPGEERKIDNGYLVAWTADTQWDIGFASTGRVGATLFSGEGLVGIFKGPGTVFVQTRSIKGLANALIPYLPTNNSGGGGDISLDFN